MLAKNLDVQRGLVNGARGVVVGFNKKNQGTVHEAQMMLLCYTSILKLGVLGSRAEGW